MTITEVPVPKEIINELSESFRQGPMWTATGLRSLNEETVARIDGLAVVIQALEHPPPHFHVRFAGQNASFSIADGTRLPGVKGLEKYDHNIRKWWSDNQCTLIATWNRTRPDKCPVGPMDVPLRCQPPDAKGEEE